MNHGQDGKPSIVVTVCPMALVSRNDFGLRQSPALAKALDGDNT
jgi:hypothetical protein